MSKPNSNYIVDHSARWQIGYCPSGNVNGKYHLMITDKVKLFDPDPDKAFMSSATRTIGYYTKSKTQTIVDFLMTQSPQVIESVWYCGK